ncbi:MAG: AbrB/MazE/SpoVT family DNA-binding domain-containing protein [Actinobacteria bacterium]|nr:AbrB/MazE/SpoVT family DNA-binding domain-containing protein [Actinomycetota bacterium]
MVLTIKVSKKNQVVVPKQARRLLGIKPGNELLVKIKEDRIILIPKPKDFTKHMEGLHKEIWEGIDATEYIRREREAW